MRSLTCKQEYEESTKYSSIPELRTRLNLIDCHFWATQEVDGTLIFLHLTLNPVPQMSKVSAVVSADLTLKAFYGGIQLSKLGNLLLPMKVDDISELTKILGILENLNSLDNFPDAIDLILDILKLTNLPDTVTGNENSVTIIQEQLSLLKEKPRARCYSPDILIFSCLLFTLAPEAYRFIRDSSVILLPHPNTIKGICHSYNASPQTEQNLTSFLGYMEHKFHVIEESDRIISLVIEEIHLKQNLDYKGGDIVGKAHDCDQSSSSALVFIVKSVCSEYKDVAHVLPANNINDQSLHEILKAIITGLEKIGFNVVCIITDNNSVNSEAVSLFLSPPKLQYVYPHPVESSRPLFFMVDPIHILKSIRNNWVDQKNEEQCMFYPEFKFTNASESQPIEDTEVQKFSTASWSTLQKMHCLDVDSLAKYGLCSKSLAPNNIEKQNVNLALKIFNASVIEGLMHLGKNKSLPHYEGTAKFLKIILTWWNIMNVQHMHKEDRLNNSMQTPLTCKETDEKVIFLKKVLDWLDDWESLNCETGCLSRETHSALKLSTQAILEIASYCVTEKHFDNILQGKFQTDDIEGRFGMYR